MVRKDSSNRNFIHDDTQAPEIDLVGVPLLALEDFGGDIVGRTTNGTLPLPIEFEFGCQTEVTYFDFHFIVKEEVSQLEISVDDSMRVQVPHRVANLRD